MKPGYRIAVVLALGHPLAGCGNDPQALLARARQEYAAHDYKAAQLDLAAVLKAQPNDPAALELHARTALATGDGVSAKAALDALGAARRPADFALLVGESALLREQPREAVAAVAQDRSAEGARIRALAALQLDDTEGAAGAFAAGDNGRDPAARPTARYLADYARFRLHQGDTAGARALVARALKADPAALDAQLVDARLAVAEGNLGRALTIYDAVGKGWPGNLAALTGKAAVLGDLGRTKEMQDVLAAAAGAGISEPGIAYLQARAAAARNDWQGARTILQASERQLAGRTDAQLLYAQVLTRLGQPEQARARLQPLLTKNPADLAVRRALAQAALAAHDPAGAVEALRPLAAQPTSASEDLRVLANAAQQARDPDAAKFAERAKYPSPQELAKTLADADSALKTRNWGNAIAAYEHVMAVTDGRNALVLNNLAFAQDQVGNKQVALDYALRALKQAPGNASVMDTAGWLMIQTGGDKARALQLLRTAAQKAPENATIAAHLAAATRT